MSLTGLPLLLLLGAATLVAPVVTGIFWRRARTRRLGVVGRVAAVLGCQVLAVATTFLVVNRDFVFYASWADVLGTGAPSTAQIQTQDLVKPGQGSDAVLQVHGGASGASAPVLIWRPPQYDQPAYAHTRFPVLKMLVATRGDPAVSSLVFPTGGHNYRNYAGAMPAVLHCWGRAASAAEDEHVARSGAPRALRTRCDRLT